jgi:streptogramin lyase
VGDARRRPDEFALPSVLRATTAVPSPWSLAFAPRTGQIWFTVHGEGLVGRLPSGAQPTRRGFVVEELALGPGTRPDGIAVDAAGAVWVAGSARDVLVRIDPADGSMRRIPLPAGSHPRGLAADGERGVWAALAGAGSVARVGAAGAVTTWRLPTGGRAFPVAVAGDGAGGAWIADYGADAIVRWHARARRFATFALPRPGTRVHAIAVDGRGRLWYVGAFGGVLGVVE